MSEQPKNNSGSGRGPGRQGGRPGGRRTRPGEGAEPSVDSKTGNELVEKVIFINRSSKVVKGGRRFSFAALVVVGNGRGKVGWGYGKANEVPPSVEKASKDGQRSMIEISTDGGTIPHQVEGRFGAARVVMVPAAPGTGVIAGSAVRAVCEAAGIHNILTKSFGSQVIWQDVSLTLPAGEISVLLGPSGTGKSVFLETLVGLLRPDRGSVWIDGQDVPKLRERDLYAVRKLFGVLFQDGAMFGSMNLYDNVAFPLREHTKKSESEIRNIVMEKMDLVGLLGHPHADLLVRRIDMVKEAEIDAGGVLGVEGEVDAVPAPRGPEGIRFA